MDELRIIILAIIQGITEFLPISSSGHIVLFEYLFGYSNEDIVLEVVLHFGTLISILIFFKGEILDLLQGLVRKKQDSISYLIKIILATIPVVLVVIFFGDTIKEIFSINVLLYTYVFNAVILLLTKNNKSKKKILPFSVALAMGIAQIFALFPGISRAGITICTGLLLGCNQRTIAKFSFFMAIPALMGAALFEYENIIQSLSVAYTPIVLGFLFSVFTGLFALKILFKILENQKMWMFGYYCIFIWLFIIIIR